MVRGHLETPLKGWAPDCPGFPFSEYIYQFFIGNRHKEFCVEVAFSFGNLFIDDEIKSLVELIQEKKKSLEDRIKSF